MKGLFRHCTYFQISAALLALALPLLIYSHYADYRLFSAEREEITQSLTGSTEDMILRFEQEMVNLENISLSIQNSSLIRAYNYNAENASTWLKTLIIAELSNYHQTNAFTSDIFFCLRDSQTVYSTAGMYSLNNIVPDVLPYSSWTKVQFVYDITTAREPQWRKGENIISRGNYLTLLYPIPPYNDKPYATILYLIGKSEFRQLILSSVQDGTIVQVFDDSGNAIYSSNDSLHFTGLGLTGNHPGHCVDYGGVDYYYVGRRSQKTGFSFYSVIPRQTLLPKLEYRHSPLLYQGIIRTVVVLALAFILSQLLYRPWRRLARAVGQAGPEAPAPGVAGLLQLFRQLSHSQDTLAQQMGRLQEPMHRWVLAGVLDGRLAEVEHANNQLGANKLLLDKPNYIPTVVTLAGDIPSSTTLLQLLKEQWERWAPTGWEVHLPGGHTPGTFILLLGCDNIQAHQLEITLQKMRDMLMVLLECQVCIAAGPACSRLEDLPQALGQAYRLLHYRVIHGSAAVLLPSLPSSHPFPRFYPAAQVGELEAALMSCDRDKVETAVSLLVEHVRVAGYSPEMAACILGDVAGVLFRCSLLVLQKDKAAAVLPVLLQQLGQSCSLPELPGIVRLVSDAFGQREPSEEKRSLDITSLYRYIEEHYCTYAFSVQGMARHFHVSASNLTHFFKKNTGSTILDYVNTKRIDRATQLLVTSDMPLKEIVKSIGFSDTSTFIKKFRGYFGMTPGQYKEQFAPDAFSPQ